MWRLMGIGLIAGAVWAGSQFVPRNDEQRLASIIDILAQGDRPSAAPSSATRIETADGSFEADGLIAADGGRAAPAAEATRSLAVSEGAEPRLEIAVAMVPAGAPGTEVVPVVAPEVRRAEFTIEIQRELRRVGCYNGPINGNWGIATRRAVRKLVRSLEAELETDVPDGRLLVLIARQDDRVCGRACISGLKPDAKGRCVEADRVASTEERTLRVRRVLAGMSVEAEALSKTVAAAVPPPHPHPVRVASAGTSHVPTLAEVPEPIAVLAPPGSEGEAEPVPTPKVGMSSDFAPAAKPAKPAARPLKITKLAPAPAPEFVAEAAPAPGIVPASAFVPAPVEVIPTIGTWTASSKRGRTAKAKVWDKTRYSLGAGSIGRALGKVRSGRVKVRYSSDARTFTRRLMKGSTYGTRGSSRK